MQTVRFARIVETAGRPETALVFRKPEENKALMKAVREHRVMTMMPQIVGTKAAQGEIGLVKEKNNIYLVFPKSLKRFEGKRVVGIKFDLIREVEGDWTPEPEKKPAKTAKTVKEKQPSPLHRHRRYGEELTRPLIDEELV
jgi:hypothetical protein